MVEARCTRGCEGVCSVEIVGYLVSIKGDFVYEWMNELLYVYHAVYSLLFSSPLPCHTVIDCRCIYIFLLFHILLFHITVKKTLLAERHSR